MGSQPMVSLGLESDRNLVVAGKEMGTALFHPIPDLALASLLDMDAEIDLEQRRTVLPDTVLCFRQNTIL